MADVSAAEALACAGFPDYQHVVVLPSQRGQVGLVAGEAEGLDQHLVQLHTVDRLSCGKVPDYDFCLKAHVGLLATGQQVP